MQRFWTGCILAVSVLTSGVHAQTQHSSGYIQKVVIDAGHGGTDPGALGTLYKEKDITLKIALQLGKQIKAAYPGMNVIYTRNTDTNVSLYERADIANKANADLFISIHCNSVANRSSAPQGVETLVMGTSKMAANLEVAKIENAAMLLEDNYESVYEGFNPNAPEKFILRAKYQEQYLIHSIDFASMVQQQFKKAGRQDRGAKQAGIYVLWKTAAPSVLIEVGFMTNPEEEKWMNSTTGRDKIVDAILTAFKTYKSNMDGRSNWSVVDSQPVSTSPAQQPAVEPSILSSNRTAASAPVSTAVPASVPAPASAPAVPVTQTTANLQTGIVFAVQVRSSSNPIPANSQELRGYSGITEVKVSDNSYKYVMYPSTSFAEVQARVPSVRSIFHDAFMTAFRNGQPISLQEARNQTGQ